MRDIFIRYSVDKLNQLAGRIDSCLLKLDSDQIWWRGAEHQNAVGNLILHLCGNLGQWILSAVGDAPDTRIRDAEFDARGDIGVDELRTKLSTRVAETVAVFESLTPERLEEMVHVQKYDVTVLEAVYHVVEHFSQHTGQIMYATKLLAGSELGFYGHLAQTTHAEKTP
ncbi:MAG: DUF1572 family protein [Bryobacteraceae bacterium]|nr:DUF1572 family protein [Bryobacteraceae bacterium]